MANQLNEFDRLIKETYESQEFPYDSSVWDGIEKELGATSPGVLDFFKSVTTGLAIAGAVFATMLIFTSDTGSNNPVVQEVNRSSQVTSAKETTVSKNFQEGETSTSEDSIQEETFLDSDNHEANSDSNSINNGGERKEDGNFTDDQKSTVVAVLAEAKKISSTPESNESDKTNLSNEDKMSASVKKGCTGLTINFSAPEEYGANAKYLWNFGDGFFSNDENPTHVFNKEGIFDVSLSVTAVGSGQISSNVVQAMIEVQEAPEARFDLEINSMRAITLREKSMNAADVELRVDNEKQSLDYSDILLSVADNTKFDVELVAENAANCSDSLAKEIHIIKAGNQFPKLYSSAYASDFAPGAIVDNGVVTDFRVFKKDTGEEVFKSSGSKGWNGMNKNNQGAAKGEYEWMMIVDAKDVFNIYHGNLTLR